MAIAVVEIDPLNRRRVFQLYATGSCDLLHRLVQMGQVVCGNVFDEAPVDLGISVAAIHPAETEKELRRQEHKRSQRYRREIEHGALSGTAHKSGNYRDHPWIHAPKRTASKGVVLDRQR